MGSAYTNIGIDLGQRVDPTCICVVEAAARELEPERWVMPEGPGMFTGRDARRIPAKTETIYTVRFLSRLPLNTPYPRIYEVVADLLGNLQRYTERKPRLYIDATGALPALDSLREALRGKPVVVVGCMFNHGDKLTPTGTSALPSLSVGKAFLVSRLQALLQWNRLILPARSPEAESLKNELLNYEIKVDPDGDAKYGSFRTGQHDDLATALGLAVLSDPIAEARRGRVVMHHGWPG